ncbi:hypothetical protein GH714_041680 [Hevea brasiliensis]|uniref:Uncharacterized protein n=1 Tax=Hevea brasiliensis TaxID=3981 RepID=A0A6A6MWR1_HEVBR|nr:hypothetical protein GH714_041680 [Hevea brasiliensis]
MQDPGSTVSFCLSFNSYSSDQLACIAAKVGEEEATNGAPVSRNQNENESSGSYGDVDDDDFEFVLVRSNPDACTTIDGDHEVAFPVFPLFDRDLLLSCGNESNKQSRDHEEVTSSAVRLPLKNLFIEDRDPPSSSSSEADELDRVSQGTFCVWAQQRSSPSPSPSPSPSASPSQSRCKKSNSTGSSSKQRWRLRDLLHLRRFKLLFIVNGGCSNGFYLVNDKRDGREE